MRVSVNNTIRQTIILLTVFFFIFFIGGVYAQINGNPLITAQFSKVKFDIDSDKTAFNILTVTNISPLPQNLVVVFSIPEGWSLLRNNEENISLGPGEKIEIPLRIAPGKKVSGGIAHVLSASVYNENNRQLASAFSYMRTSEIRMLSISIQERYRYMKMNSRDNNVHIEISNRGNAAEIINFEFEASQPLQIEKAEANNKRILTIKVPPYTDTIFHVTVIDAVKEGDPLMSRLPRLKIQAVTSDSTHLQYVWFKRLTSVYKPEFGFSQSPLNVGLLFNNLMGEANPSINAIINGSILLKNKRSVIYNYYTPLNTHNNPEQYLWRNSYIQATFHDKNWYVSLGDVGNTGALFSMHGRGVTAGYTFNKGHNVSAHASRSPLTPISNFGLNGEYFLSKFGKILGGAGYSNNEILRREKKIAYAGFITSYKQHSLMLNAGISDEIRAETTSPFNLTGFGINGGYGGSFFNRINTSIIAYYGSRDFVGYSQGQTLINAHATYRVDNTANLRLTYDKNSQNTPIWFLDSLLPEIFTNWDKLSLRYNMDILPRVQVFAEPSLTNENTNVFYQYSDEGVFGTSTASLMIGSRFIAPNRRTNFSFTYSQSYSYITQYGETLMGKEFTNVKNISAIPSSEFGCNIRELQWGIMFRYSYWPYSINQIKDYFYYNYNIRRMSISPYYKRYIYKDIVELDVRANYDSYFPSQSERFNLSGGLSANIDPGWQIAIHGNYYFNSRYDKQNETFNTYKSINLQAGINKSFGIQQPRHKYYNVILTFYKDFDGNNKMDENEPGISDVIVYMERQSDGDSLNPAQLIQTFPVTELLTDIYGRAMYYKVPEGVYKIKYRSLGKNGDEYIDLSGNEKTITVDRNLKVFLPFGVNYRVFGSIVMNRDPNSNLGRVDVGNIKVTAIGPDGKNYSTLTERDGSFVLFVPAAGTYRVRMNNIFYEKFDLVQNDYIINFDGFKQFQVQFELNEKRRGIIFGNDD